MTPVKRAENVNERSDLQGRRKPFGVRSRPRILAIAFVVPFLLFNVFVIVWPAVQTLGYSFTDWDGLSDPRFAGLDNYKRMLGSAKFWQAFEHNIVWTIVFLTVPVGMGLFGAFLLSQIRRARTFFRVAFFIPYMLASVVNAFIWEKILSPNTGLVSVLTDLGAPGAHHLSFFGNKHLALGSVAFIDNWHWWGFVAVLFLTAMQSVDQELYDAADVDGATRWKQFRHITIPGIRPTLVFVLLLTVIWSLLTFDYVYIITQGGPAGASELVTTLLYKEAFTKFDVGYASSLGMSMTFISAVVIGGYVFLTKKRGWQI